MFLSVRQLASTSAIGLVVLLIGLLFASAARAGDEYTPPVTNGPRISQGAGTR